MVGHISALRLPSARGALPWDGGFGRISAMLGMLPCALGTRFGIVSVTLKLGQCRLEWLGARAET